MELVPVLVHAYGVSPQVNDRSTRLCLGPDRVPHGIRVIVLKERPHPGAQLRLSDPDGNRYTWLQAELNIMLSRSRSCFVRAAGWWKLRRSHVTPASVRAM